MAFAGNAPGRWLQMTGTRRGLLNRCEVYAAYTLPKICLPDDFHQNNQQMSHDFQAVGAQAVNHLSNKMMLALFAPSRPFFRLDATSKAQAEIAAVGAPQDEITKMLAKAEKDAIKRLDKLSLRPKLYEAIKHLIVTGNVMVCFEPEAMRVVGLKKYAVRRSVSGKLIEIMLADKILMDELDEDVRSEAERFLGREDDRKVTLYRWIKMNRDGEYEMTQWVDNFQLPKRFNGKWPEADLPYRVLTWDLADGQDYGTGLVEDYSSDFSGLSALSKAQVQGAILASEFRWLVNPAGQTRVDDFASTPNGGAMPGMEGDIHLIQSGKSSDLQITLNMSAEYVNRIGRGFLLGSMLVRDAERVTAEEIRMTANELETALGGGYSRIAVDFQVPMGNWLLASIDINVGDNFEVTVVTGLDALSRSGDLDELKLWLGDMASLASLPEALQLRLNLDTLAIALAAPRRIDVDAYVKSAQQVAQETQAAQAQQVQMQAAEAGTNVAAQAAIAEQGQP